MLSGETQRHALPRYHSHEMKKRNISNPRWGIESTTVRFTIVLEIKNILIEVLNRVSSFHKTYNMR